MIVLDEHNGFTNAFDFLKDSGCEFAVDVLVVLPVGGPKKRPGMRDVAKRPESFIGKSVVVAFLFFLAEPNAAQSVARIVGWNAQTVRRIHDFGVSIAIAVSNPRTIAGVEYGFERGDQTARRNYDFDCPPISLVRVRLTIGNDK